MKKIFNQKATLSLMILMILMALILGVMLLMNNDNEKYTESYLYSTTASISILDIGYDNGSNIINPATISASLYYDNVTDKHIVTTTLSKGAIGSQTTGTCGADNDGEYGANMPFVKKNRGLRISITSLASGTRIAMVGGYYNSLESYLFEETYTVSNNKNSYSKTITFDVGSNTEKGTFILIGVSFYFKYQLYDLNNNSHEIWLDVSNDTVSGYSYNNYKRIGYKLEGFYTEKNGKGRKVFSVDDNNNISTSGYPYTPNSNLYPYYTPKDYRVDVNVLNPNGTQDYKSGTFTQYYSYTDSTSYNLTDQAYSTIKQGSYTEIRNIVPVAGYYLYNVTATVGTIENRGNGVYRYTASFSSEPKGSSSWDAVINVQMRYINYSVIFNANGGSGNMKDQSFIYGTSQNLTENSFERGGYTFAGWNTEKNGTGTSYSDGELVNNLSSANTNNATVTLYAQWTAQNLKVNFNYNGGKVVRESDSQKYSSNGTYLSGIPTDDEMSKTGYTFKGWSLTPNDTGAYYDADTNWNNITVNSTNNKEDCSISDAGVGNIEFTLYAMWKPNEYSVNINIYNPNGVEEYTTNINGTFTLRDDEGNVITGLYNEPSDHYITFGKNWQVYDIVAGTGRKLRTTNPVTCGGGLTMSENNGVYTFTCTGTSGHTINIYMEYISYTIAFNGNDNTGGSTSSMKATYDSDVTLTTNGFIKAGYVFTGWKESDGSGKSYSDKETVKNLTSVDGATVTLYAQWKETWANHASSSLKTTQINGVTYNVIASAEDLAYLSKQSISSTLLGKYIQTADIDLNDYTWLPIGSENAFCGEYLGQGYKITGLKTCDAKNANKVYLQTYGGLFGKLGENSTTDASANIVGVYITDCLVYGQYSGAIAGFSDDESVNIDSVNIEACILENVEIYGDTNTTASFVGLSSGGQIKDCLLISSNISTANTTTRGFYTGTMTVKSCYFVENKSATKFTGESSDYSNWVTGVFKYPLPKALIWYPGA